MKIPAKEKELGLALLFQTGIGTLEERDLGPKMEFRCRIPPGISPKTLLKKLACLEAPLAGRPLFEERKIIIYKPGSWVRKYTKGLRRFPFPGIKSGPELPALFVDPRRKTPKKRREDTLYLEAGLAFGTGLHISTRLAGRLLEKSLAQKGRCNVLDVGCGSGILALLAKKRGAGLTAAIDSDLHALEEAKKNFARNKMRGIQLYSSLSRVRKRFSIIVANILLNTLLEIHPSLQLRLKTDGYLILSGLLYRDCPKILSRYKSLRLVERINEKGWSALLLQKAPHSHLLQNTGMK